MSLLVSGLMQAGHDVTLFASGDSVTPARLVSHFAEARIEALGSTQPELLHALRWVAHADAYDVISDHSGPLGLTLSNLTRTPVLHTVHGALAGEAGELYRSACGITPSAALVALTESHRGTAADLPWAATIPNAIALEDHPCRSHRGGGYLAWLGRMSPDKGPVKAIQVARAVGMPLLLAGKLSEPSERRYFDREVRPRLGKGIVYVGEVDRDDRVRLLHGARALINPISWEEPFGLAMVEAMACGVPVIATPRGSVPEVVVHGRTGWIVSSVEAMAAAVERCHEIDPLECRAVADRRFSPERMVQDYLRALRSVMNDPRPARPAQRHAPTHDPQTSRQLDRPEASSAR